MIRLGKPKAANGTDRKEKKRGKPPRQPASVPVAPPAPIEPGQYEFSRELVALVAPGSRAAASISEAAALLIDRHVDQGRRGLAICAAASGAGVSFMAANLAVTLAEAGVSTILIDGNLRRPALERFIRPADPVPGLQQFLRSDRLGVDDIIHPEVLPNLSVVYAGGAAADAQELRAGPRLRLLLRECMRNHACTLVDTPPGNRCSDAMMVAAILGYAAIVAPRNTAYVTDVERLSEQLTTDGAVVVGAILNQA